MPALDALERTIATVTDLQSVVRTMKALSGASIRQYERAAEALAEYQRTVELGLQAVLGAGLRPAAPADRRRRPGGGRLGAVVFGSDHGLCGRFNEDVALFAAEHLRPAAGGAGLRLMAVGYRAGGHLAALGLEPEKTRSLPASAEAITGTVQDLLLEIDAWMAADPDLTVLLFHNARPAGHPLPRP
ncbi:F0F1 ATP synthase subunit gamma, partial [Dissulfurirhabdus thermomarina]